MLMLTESQLQLILNAMRAAGDRYGRDALQAHIDADRSDSQADGFKRIAAQFERQQTDVLHLAMQLEDSKRSRLRMGDLNA